MMNLSHDFYEKLILFILTAAITGVFVPLLFKWRDERKLGEQKAHEAQLARQGKIIEAQVALLENLAKQLWEFQNLAFLIWMRLFNQAFSVRHQSIVQLFQQPFDGGWTDGIDTLG